MFPRVMDSRWARQTNRAFTLVPEKSPVKYTVHIQKKYESISPPSSPQLLACLSIHCLPSFSRSLAFSRSVLSLPVSSLPLIHGMQHWHIHNQTDLTLHILPQWERRRLRQELYTRPSLLISRSQHQAPPPSISPSLSGLCARFLSFFLSCLLLILPFFVFLSFFLSFFSLFSPIV